MPKLPERIDEATYLPLAMAAEAAAVRGIAPTVTVKALRREGARGRLAIYRFSGRDHTTLGDIRRMFEMCRVQAPALALSKPVAATSRLAGALDRQSVEMNALMESVSKLASSSASRRERSAPCPTSQNQPDAGSS